MKYFSTCEDNMLFSDVKISCFRPKAWYFIGVYVINRNITCIIISFRANIIFKKGTESLTFGNGFHCLVNYYSSFNKFCIQFSDCAAQQIKIFQSWRRA